MPNTPDDGRNSADTYTTVADEHKVSPAESGQFRFLLSTNLAELAPLAEAVESFAEQCGWGAAVTMQINLILEEIVVNAIDYGYPDGRAGRIEVFLDASPGDIRIRIEDDGDAFDPFSQAPPNLSANLADRPIGGLGLHLVRSYADSCAYRYVNGRNRIDLVKRLAPLATER
jgi:serine/threonine-protein kinase RsbW